MLVDEHPIAAGRARSPGERQSRIATCVSTGDLRCRIAATPDVIIIDTESPSRYLLESLQAARQLWSSIPCEYAKPVRNGRVVQEMRINEIELASFGSV
jgi:hypothetical protein